MATALDEGSNRSASAVSTSALRWWVWVLRGSGFALTLGLVPWLVSGGTAPLALMLPAGGIGAWVGWRMWLAEQAIARLQEMAAIRERELLGRAWYARSVLQNAFDAVLVVGSDDRVMDGSRRVETLFGVQLDALSGTPLSGLLPELAAPGAHPGAPSRTVAVHADGSQFDVDVRSSLLGAGPAPELPWGRARVVVVREASREALGRQLREAAERQRGRWVAEQRRRGQVLGLIGRGIRDHTERLAAVADHASVGPLAEIGDGLQEQTELLWTLAMWERSGADPTLGPVDVAVLVRDAAAEVDPVASRRGNTLSLKLEPQVAEVVTDGVLLRCAVRTLLLLAVRGTRDATVRVEVVREAGRGTDWVTVLVDDDRCQPLSPEAREAIQAAFDASEDPSPPTDGRAGVALVRRLARSLGGHVAVGTHPTLGTSLSLRVPVDPTRVRRAPAQPCAGGRVMADG